MKNHLIVVFLFLILISGLSSASEYEIIQVSHGYNYRWSPDGKYLSYYQNNYLYLYNVETYSPRQAGNYYGLSYEWFNDSQIVFMDRNHLKIGTSASYNINITYITISSSKEDAIVDSTTTKVFDDLWKPHLISDNFGSVALLIGNSTEPLIVNHQKSIPKGVFRVISHYPVVHQGREPIYDDTDLWLIDINGKKIKKVTQGKQFLFPLLSPNGTLICASDVSQGNLLIIDTNGLEISNLGQGVYYCWSYQSDAVYFATSIEDGMDILGGDLFCYSLKNDTITQLTNTPSIAEFKPQVSPDGTMLAYRTYHKEPDGIEILILKGGKQ